VSSSTTPPLPAPTLLPVAAAFVLFGTFWGAWAVSTADVERTLGVSHGQFGLLLSVALIGASVANAVVGSLTERWGTAPTMRRSLMVWGTLVAAGALAAGYGAALFGLSVVAVVSSGGALDVVINIAATAALGPRPGRLVRFHALFNVGAAIGAITTGVLLHNGLTWRWPWVGAAAGAWTLAALSRRVRLPAGEAGERHRLGESVRVLHRERLLVLALAMAAGAMVEGGIDTWGVLYLRDQLASGLLVGTAAAALGYGVAAVARATLGPVAGSGGTSKGIAAGGTLAAVGLVGLAVLHVPALAGIGLVVAAGGISMSWPLLLARASTGAERPGVIVGGVSAVGYLGLVAGPAVVGWLASVAGLRTGLLVLAAAAVFVAIAPSSPGQGAAVGIPLAGGGGGGVV
jgi:MFS family permease